MKKFYIFLFVLIVLVSSINSQQDKQGKSGDEKGTDTKKKTQLNILPPIIRDIDVSKFQRNKLYISFIDSEGNPIQDLDSTNFSIIEKETGEEVKPSTKIFYDSDEGMIICFAMDASLSMDGPPLNNVKVGLLNTISKFRYVDKMGLAYFHNEFYKKCEFGNDREVLKNNISELTAGGTRTILFESIIKSIEWLNKQTSPKRKILIVISDGDDNGSKNSIEDCIEEIQKSNITVFTIGSIKETKSNVGSLMNLDKIARASKDGNYYKIDKSEDISRIIPLIYDRIKEEYLIEYWSYAKPNQTINLKVEINYKNKTYITDTTYKSPDKIVENAPAKSFFKTKEFLYGAIAAGVIILALIVFLFLNISKKKKFKLEKESEAELRRKESEEFKARYNQLYSEYENLLDKLQSQSSISESDKQKVESIERQLTEMSKTRVDIDVKPVDFGRRTQILSGKTNNIQDNKIFNLGKLVIIEGAGRGREFAVGNEQLLIGRTEGKIILNENIVSRRHAVIYKQNNSFIIEDLNSTNGTFLNDFKITRAQLKSGDIIKIGTTKLQFILS